MPGQRLFVSGECIVATGSPGGFRITPGPGVAILLSDQPVERLREQHEREAVKVMLLGGLMTALFSIPLVAWLLRRM